MPRTDPQLLLLLERKAYYEKHPDEALRSPGAVPDPKQVLNISVRFEGDISALTETGYKPGSVFGQVSYGAITLQDLPKLIASKYVLAIQKQRRENLHLNKSVPDIKADKVWDRSGENFSNITGKNVIVGIVDTGINFRHESFRKPDGTTRIKMIWDQTLTATGSEKAPAAITDAAIGAVPLGYGVEYTEQQINGALQNAGLPVTVRHQDVDGHGTHVSGIAAGNGRNAGNCNGRYTYIGVAPEADIIMVRKWGLSKGDANAPSTSSGTVMDAISYILNQAKHHINKPVAINLSLGSFTELMDGSSNDCRTMDSMLTNTANDEGFAIVFAAGNEGNSNFHAKDTVPASGTLSLRFRVMPHDAANGDIKDRFITIVYTGSNLQVRVTSPVSGAAGTVGWVAPNAHLLSNTANGTNKPGETTAPSVEIFNAPNSITIHISHGSGTNTHVAGEWKLELQDTGSAITSINAFCLYGSTHDAEAPYFLDSVTVQTTLSEQATGTEVISVGSYYVGDGSLAKSSGRGFTLDLRQKPEITAPGVGITSATIESTLTCANCCCDCCHDYYITMSGTSMAAPHVTGAAALLLQKNPSLKHTEILNALVSTARAKPAGSSLDEDMGWGAGKLDAKAAADSITATGGGGGITGPHAAFHKPVFNGESIDKEENLFERFRKSKRGPELSGLFHRYFREVRDLINTNKKVATVWHRSKGPAWIRAAIRAGSAPEQPLPFEIEGFSLYEGIERMMTILRRYGSQMLIRDLNHYQHELIHLEKGMNVYQLMEVFTRPATVNVQ